MVIKNIQFTQNFTNTAIASFVGGIIASFITQPLEVLKTMIIINPQNNQKISKGNEIQSLIEAFKIIQKTNITYFFRGSSIAMMRQGIGFMFYSNSIQIINNILIYNTQINKFLIYSISSIISKLFAMTLEAPLSLLKTRREVILNNVHKHKQSLSALICRIQNEQKSNWFRGLTPTLFRQLTYSLINYTLYRFIKDQIIEGIFHKQFIFVPAFLGSSIALIISQPFQVARNKIIVDNHKYGVKIIGCMKLMYFERGLKGFYRAFLPRLLRKPINSGLCWSFFEYSKGITPSAWKVY